MKYKTLPTELFRENRRRIAAALPHDAFAVLHSADIPWRCADGFSHFIQNSDLFYLTGIDQEETILVLCPGHPDVEKREVLFVRETSERLVIWEGHKLTLEEASDVSGISHVEWNDQFMPFFRRIARKFQRIFLNHNEHSRSVSPTGITPDDYFRKRCQFLYPHHRYERLAPLMHALRVIKSDHEIELLRIACDITKKGFLRSLDFIKPGVKEYEVEAELAHEFIRHGSRGFAYEPIIASGKNACVLHYLGNDQTCRDGDLLLMDVAAEYANYNADLTRTVPVGGKFTPRQRQVYDSVLRIFRLCVDQLATPGKHIKNEYHKEVARATEEELIGLGLLDQSEVREERKNEELAEEKRLYQKYFMHGVSHSLGIDVHDVTPASGEFFEGMCITVEPGIYLPEEGFGIRLENDIIIHSSGNIDLMESIPIEADEIEALMAK